MSELIYEQLRQLAGKIPCELCEIKGGSNIEADGGCRHRPIVTGAEVSARVARRMNGIMFDLPVKAAARYESNRALVLAFLNLPWYRRDGLLRKLGENPDAQEGTETEKFAACFNSLKNQGRTAELAEAIYEQEQLQKK